MRFCAYYQAAIKRTEVWFLVAALRSYEHLAFDRTIDKQNNIFEFFVPEDFESVFVQIMLALQERGVVHELHKLPNRMMLPGAQI